MTATLPFPPPWTLHGQGIMLFYRFSKAFVKNSGLVDSRLADQFRGGLGSVMLVNYTHSPVGPYREVLFMPGVFHTPRGRRRHIPKIYVDSEASVAAGRANWGLPKELASFTWEEEGRHTHIAVQHRGHTFLEVDLHRGVLPLPISTALVPIHLYQTRAERTFLTHPQGRGRGYFTRLRHVEVDPAFFPDFDQGCRLAAVHVRPFTMRFPAAKITAS